MQLKEALVFSHNRKSGSYSQLCMKGGEEAAGVVWGRGILFSNDKKNSHHKDFLLILKYAVFLTLFCDTVWPDTFFWTHCSQWQNLC